jgi:hypothetical protein
VKCLSKGLHPKKSPILPHVPLSTHTVRAKLKSQLDHSKPLTSPLSPVSRVSKFNTKVFFNLNILIY